MLCFIFSLIDYFNEKIIFHYTLHGININDENNSKYISKLLIKIS